MDRKKWERGLRRDILDILEDEVEVVEMIDSAPGVVGLEEASARIMQKIGGLLDAYFSDDAGQPATKGGV